MQNFSILKRRGVASFTSVQLFRTAKCEFLPMFTCGMAQSHSTTKCSQSKHPKPGCWQGTLTESPETSHSQNAKTPDDHWSKVRPVLLFPPGKRPSQVTGNSDRRNGTEARASCISREKADWWCFRSAGTGAMNTLQLAGVANSTYEPPEPGYTSPAKSRPAKQHRTKQQR